MTSELNPATWVLVGIAVIIILALIGWALTRQRRTEHLRSRFGPEYDRTVLDRGNARRAEAELAARERRVAKFRVRPLDPSVRDRFVRVWTNVQSRFVDDPAGAVVQADQLVNEVMRVRGYPESAADVELRAADISVDHPNLVENYRAAADMARHRETARVSTEELRRALVYYRALFDDLLEVQGARS